MLASSRILAFALLLSSAAPTHAGSTVCDDLTFVDTARQATVTIRTPGPDGEEEDTGAGFHHAGSGKIITNAHVVGDLETLTIGLADGRVIPGRVVGRDPFVDVAVIEADLYGVPALEFSDAEVEVGETVHAVGTPFGLGQTVTRGVVSAMDRAIDANTPFGMIQHDAALNPGSSGGPVLDPNGKVIGINVAMPDGFRRDVGVAYAIPAAIAEKAIERIVAGLPTVERRIGVVVRTLTPRLAEALGVESGAGALVETVAPRSAAAKAGIVPSDIVLTVGDHPVAELRDVAIGLDRADPTEALSLTILRGDEKLSLTLPPETLKIASATPRKPLRGGGKRALPAAELGFTLAGFGAAEIVEVGKGTPAAAAGLGAGDVILAVGRATVSDSADAKRLIGDSIYRPFALLLADSRGGTRYVVVDPWAGGLDGDRLGGNMRNPRSAAY